jgi:hypothetical protein
MNGIAIFRASPSCSTNPRESMNRQDAEVAKKSIKLGALGVLYVPKAQDINNFAVGVVARGARGETENL